MPELKNLKPAWYGWTSDPVFWLICLHPEFNCLVIYCYTAMLSHSQLRYISILVSYLEAYACMMTAKRLLIMRHLPSSYRLTCFQSKYSCLAAHCCTTDNKLLIIMMRIYNCVMCSALQPCSKWALLTTRKNQYYYLAIYCRTTNSNCSQHWCISLKVSYCVCDSDAR